MTSDSGNVKLLVRNLRLIEEAKAKGICHACGAAIAAVEADTPETAEEAYMRGQRHMRSLVANSMDRQATTDFIRTIPLIPYPLPSPPRSEPL